MCKVLKCSSYKPGSKYYCETCEKGLNITLEYNRKKKEEMKDEN